MKLEITKEKVLEAAAKCETAKETLKTLFPEVFEDDKSINLLKPGFTHGEVIYDYKDVLIHLANYVCDGKYRDKAFYLSTHVNWELIKTEKGVAILIPTRK